MKKEILFEGCIDNIGEINYFIENDINRLELCRELDRGGLSPKINTVKYSLSNGIDSIVMLREKNNFKLSKIDFFKLKSKIKKYRKLGAKKYIFGFVDNGEVDIKSCQKIISLLKDDEIYGFHMAVDEANNYHNSLNTLVKLGFSWVLTKGGRSKAIDNLDTLKQIVKEYDSKIKILVGGGVTKDNWNIINSETQATWFHGRKIK